MGVELLDEPGSITPSCRGLDMPPLLSRGSPKGTSLNGGIEFRWKMGMTTVGSPIVPLFASFFLRGTIRMPNLCILCVVGSSGEEQESQMKHV